MTTLACQQCASEAVVVVQTAPGEPDDAAQEPDRLRCLGCGAFQADQRRVPA